MHDDRDYMRMELLIVHTLEYIPSGWIKLSLCLISCRMSILRNRLEMFHGNTEGKKEWKRKKVLSTVETQCF